MKECRSIITVPVLTSGNKKLLEGSAKSSESLIEAITKGFEVKHITSCSIDGDMYVYHWLEREKNETGN